MVAFALISPTAIQAMNQMNKDFEKAGITVTATLTFRDQGDDLEAQMDLLKESDARIIIGSFTEDTARAVFCQVRLRGQIYWFE